MPTNDDQKITLDIPPRIHAKLTEIAGFRSLEEWARNVLIRAAEEAQPSLTRSALWRSDRGAWAQQNQED